MAAGPFEADLAAPFGVAARGAAASPKLVAILKPGTTSWTVPRASKYTLHAWAPGGAPADGGAGAGGYARKTIPLAKGVPLTVAVGMGGVYAPDGSIREGSGPTTISGGGISISCAAGSRQTGGNAMGGDINVTGANASGANGGAAGGDGTVIGTGGYGGTTAITGGHPGGGGGNGTSLINYSGNGEIRIVDETP